MSEHNSAARAEDAPAAKHEFIEAVEEGAHHLGIGLREGAAEELYRHFEMLTDWNTRVNLTRIVTPAEAAIKHYVDSLACLCAIELNDGAAVVDVGTGPGFPGIPLKILRPDLKLTLLESNGKKAAFLRAVCESLGLDRVEIVYLRAEDAGRDAAYRERFDVGAARAVAELRVVAEYVLPLVRVSGSFVALKGPDLETEVAEAQHALSELGGRMSALTRLELPRGLGNRSIAVVSKIASCKDKYPRLPGTPAKKPL